MWGWGLTVGKYPKVKTLNKEVLPQAPSPMMTNFLQDEKPSQYMLFSSLDVFCIQCVEASRV